MAWTVFPIDADPKWSGSNYDVPQEFSSLENARMWADECVDLGITTEIECDGCDD